MTLPNKNPRGTRIFGDEAKKTTRRIKLLGEIDELVSSLSIVRSHGNPRLDCTIRRIQALLLAMGAHIADPKGRHSTKLKESDFTELKRFSNTLEQSLPPLKHFIHPGKPATAASLHLCRSIARRVERSTIDLDTEEPVSPVILHVANELSDCFFHLARSEAWQSGSEDEIWKYAGPLKNGELDDLYSG
tara:strand:+ start:2476 stop:3042 length:567 start_codon:yes stop_codon:yes gene_type:complete